MPRVPRLAVSLAACAMWLGPTATARLQAQVLPALPPSYIVAQSDYGMENGNMGGVTAGYPFAQTFTPTLSGSLFSISGGFYAPESGMAAYYTFQFRDTTAGGLPSSQVLASVVVPTTPLSQPAYKWIDLTADFSSANLNLIAGHRYAFSIDAPGAPGTTTYNNFFWGMTAADYTGGGSYFFTTTGSVFPLNEDFLFTVRAVPEPSALTLAVLFGTGLLGWRRR